MKINALIKALAVEIGTVLLILVLASIFDILCAVFYARFYTSFLFTVSFFVAGIFAAIFAYSWSIQVFEEQTENIRWVLIGLLMLLGLLFFFPIAALEGGEYASPFKGYGIGLALGSIIFIKGKPST